MTDPVSPRPSGDEPDPDEFIDEDVRFAVATRLSDGPIGAKSTEGTLLGLLTNKTSQLFSALWKGGSSVPRAVEVAPVFFQRIEHTASVDFDFEIAPAENTLTDDGPDHVFDRFQRLRDASVEDLLGEVEELGGAIAYTYARLTKVLGDRGINAEFRQASSGRKLDMPWEVSKSHSALLETQVTLDRKVVRLFGILDELKDSTSTFTLKKPKDGIDEGSREAWSDLVGNSQSLKGELTSDATDDIHGLNAWGQQIIAVVEVTQMSTPGKSTKLEVDSRLIQVEAAQRPLS